jgi:DNA (cytosine-5)-methyltransferase 1
MTKRKLKAIDLFSGCGGLSLGLRNAGFAVVAAIDSDPLAISTYRTNHPKTLSLINDIRDVNPRQLMKRLGLRKGALHLLAGCPPCQGFSTLRTLNGAKSVREPMNALLFEVLRFAQAMHPRAIMLENVPGLLTNHRLNTFGTALTALGYSFAARIFDAADFGVAQRRRRMILVAQRGGTPEFGRLSKSKITVADVIKDLPPPQSSNDPAHNYPVTRAKHVREIIARVPRNGGSRASLPRQLPCHQRLNGFGDIYGRMKWHAPAPTITGGCINPSKGRFLHPCQNRAITLREAALLQGFPRKYKFDLSRGRYPVAQLIGNAFPPMFAEIHARTIKRWLIRKSRARPAPGIQ